MPQPTHQSWRPVPRSPLLAGLVPFGLVLMAPLWGQPGPSAASSPFKEAVAIPGGQIHLAGRLQPARAVPVPSPVEGVVRAVTVREGTRVQVNQTLLTIQRTQTGEVFLPTPVTARLSGVVSRLQVAVDQEVRVGQVLLTLIDTSTLVLRAAVSDRDVPTLRSLGNAAVTVQHESGTARGRLVELSPEPDYATGLFTAVIQVEPGPDLFPGRFVRARIGSPAPAAVRVDTAAVVRLGDGLRVWVLDENRLLRSRPVQLEREEGATVVLRGLSPGERYLARPTGREEEGMDPRALRQRPGG